MIFSKNTIPDGLRISICGTIREYMQEMVKANLKSQQKTKLSYC